MLLSELLNGYYPMDALPERAIHRLVLDSRRIQKNDLFLAISGAEKDGRHFIQDAISRGAAAILTDDASQEINWSAEIPIIPIHHLPIKLGELAARFYDYPAKKMQMIGVTGTNGKTSCTHFLAQILSSMNKPCGLIGTLGVGFSHALKETGLTTPDAIYLQSFLHEFAQQKAAFVAMEVSSHSIHQARINAIDFEVGIFTNLTQDHLDYHGTMENYANVKRRFLVEFPIKNLVLNADDVYGKKWLKEFSHPSIVAYSLHAPNRSETKPFVYAKQIELSLSGISAQIVTPWGEDNVTIPLIGAFNLQNVLAVISALGALNIPLQKMLPYLQQLQSVPGRMQVIKEKNKPLIIVDYAHTPDALEKVLKSLRAPTNEPQKTTISPAPGT